MPELMDLQNDERVRRLTELIEKEEDSEKLAALIDELTRLLDKEVKQPKSDPA